MEVTCTIPWITALIVALVTLECFLITLVKNGNQIEYKHIMHAHDSQNLAAKQGNSINNVSIKPSLQILETYNKSDLKPKNNSNYSNTSREFNVKPKNFHILAWTGSFYGPFWGMTGSEPFQTCRYKNCIGTNDKSLYNQSDAVLFHMRFLKGVKLPAYRFPNQQWIMHIREPPQYEALYNELRYSSYNGLFNATWTYNRKSDIWTNYSHPENRGGMFVKKEYLNNIISNINYVQGKTKLVVWFVSHCPTYSPRMYYVRHLQKHIKVDIFGRCGTYACSVKNMAKCMYIAERDYKFFLAFENSLCDDYVTEKLWRALNMNIVPVVLGAYNYSELLPPKSYIDVKNYKSPKELADYLTLLNQNDTLYSEYLQWKHNYGIVHHPPIPCSVCEYLNQSQIRTKSYEHLDNFWNKDTDCYSPSEFYKNVDASSWQIPM